MGKYDAVDSNKLNYSFVYQIKKLRGCYILGEKFNARITELKQDNYLLIKM